MRFLEVRRHTMRVMPGQHLSQAGVTLARHVGESLGPFQRVVTSTTPRAYETAIAMGFSVDEQIELLWAMPDEVDAEIRWPFSFARAAEVIRQAGPDGALARFARAQADLWRSIANALPEGGRALVISHGGIVEAGAVACLPEADHVAWGDYCDYCEGIRLHFDGEKFTDAEILRVKG